MDMLHILVIFSTILSVMLLGIYFKNNNLLGVVYSSVFIFLVTGQNINIMYSLEESDQVYYLFNVINYQGHLYANLILVAILTLIFILQVFAYHGAGNNYGYLKKTVAKKNVKIYYYTLMFFLFIAFFLIINVVGGWNEWVESDRPVSSGSTFFLLLLTSGIYPLVFKIMSRCKMIYLDIILAVVSVIMVTSFSRFMGIFTLLQIFCAWYYSGDRKVLSKNLKVFVLAGIVFVLVFFVYGNYRHMNMYTQGMSILEIVDYVSEHWEESLFSLDMNYHIGIEGMSGLSGLITFACGNDEYFNIDLGISMITGILKLIPSNIREFLVGDLLEYLQSIYWYHGSIIAGGLECYFMHFSVFMIILYPITWYVYTNYINRKIIMLHFGFERVMYIIIGIYGLNVIRGTTANVIFYTTSEVAVAYLSYKWFRCFFVSE